MEPIKIVVLGIPLPARFYQTGPAALEAFVQLCADHLGLEVYLDNIKHVKFKPGMINSRSILSLWLDQNLAMALMAVKYKLPAGITMDWARPPAEVRRRREEAQKRRENNYVVTLNDFSIAPSSPLPATKPIASSVASSHSTVEQNTARTLNFEPYI